MRTPDAFGGERGKLSAFESAVRLYLQMTRKPLEAKDEGFEALYAASLLKGIAAEWAEPLLRESQISGKTPEELTTLDKLFEALKLQFGEIDEKLTAERAIRRLYQKASVATYAAEFTRLKVKLPAWGDEVMASFFFDSLKSDM